MFRNQPLAPLFAIGLSVLGGLCWLLPNPASGDLLLYCAAGLRVPIEKVARQYEVEHGVAIDIQYGGSNTLLSQIDVARQGDVYLAADDSYLRLAGKKQLTREVFPLAKMNAVVAVAKGYPGQVQSLEDVMKLRVAIANPEQAAIGHTTREALAAIGLWQAFRKHVRAKGVYKPTVGDVANDVKLGSVDAGILWDAVATQYSGIEVVRLPELQNSDATVAVGVLSCSKSRRGALSFCKYLASADGGLPVLAECGYQLLPDESLTPGDPISTQVRP